jgi:hypothetical protein
MTFLDAVRVGARRGSFFSFPVCDSRFVASAKLVNLAGSDLQFQAESIPVDLISYAPPFKQVLMFDRQ